LYSLVIRFSPTQRSLNVNRYPTLSGTFLCSAHWVAPPILFSCIDFFFVLWLGQCHGLVELHTPSECRPFSFTLWARFFSCVLSSLAQWDSQRYPNFFFFLPPLAHGGGPRCFLQSIAVQLLPPARYALSLSYRVGPGSCR